MHSEMQKALHCPEALPKSAQKSCLHFRNKEKMLMLKRSANSALGVL